MPDKINQQLNKLKAQIEQWLDSNEPPTAAEIEAAKRDINLLLFLSAPREGWTVSPAPAIGSPICAHLGCKAGWQEGLVNYAATANDPVWYCVKHGKKPDTGGHLPPGSLLPLKPLHDKAIEMAGRWTAFENCLSEKLKAQTEDQHFNWREK
jgi:hypothetical protein